MTALRILCLLALALVAGCGGSAKNDPAAGTPPAPDRPIVVRTDAPPPAPTGAPARTPPPSAPLPTIPVGARYTISCVDIAGDDHVARSQQLKEQLIRSTGMRDWYVIHMAESGRSVVYYGYYGEFDLEAAGDRAAKAEAERARADKQRIEAMVDSEGRRLFARSLFVPLDAPDPDAPPEWNLANSPGYWTVQIAAYSGGPERKRVAIDAVREARAMGVEAYYFHGPSVSSVCIGSFPVEAVQVFTDGREGEGARAASDNVGDTLVVSTIPLGADSSPVTDVRTGSGTARVYQTMATVRSDQLKAVMRQYPQHFTNGEPDGMRVLDKASNREVVKPRPSLLVRIPRVERGAGDGSGQEPTPTLIGPSRDRLEEKLRRIAQEQGQ